MSDQTGQETVNLDNFAQMVGFPAELIRKELFESNINESEISMADLRQAMLKYLDKTMME